MNNTYIDTSTKRRDINEYFKPKLQITSTPYNFTAQDAKRALGMKNIKKTVLLTLPFAVFIIFISTTNPTDLPLVWLLIPFVCLGVGFYGIMVGIMQSFKFGRKSSNRLIAFSVTFILLLGALLQSIGQLNVRDFVILLVLLFAIVMYLKRLKS